MSNPSPSSITLEVLKRISWRLLIVLLAVGAFFALSGLESVKSSYQKDRQAPLVIGEFTGLSSEVANARGHIIPLEYKEVTKRVGRVLFPRKSDPGKTDDLTTIRADLAKEEFPKPHIESLVASAERMRDRVLATVARPAALKDESVLIVALAQAVDAASSEEQKSY